MKTPDVAWHYTTAIGFLNILKDGKIKSSTHDVSGTETPVVWFSSNPLMEMTSRATAIQTLWGRVIRPKNAAEFRILGMGLYRIALEGSKLTHFGELVKKAKMASTRKRQLERRAAQVGSYPHEWFGCFQEVNLLESLGLECFDGKKWTPLARAGASKFVLEEQKNLMPDFDRMLDQAHQ